MLGAMKWCPALALLLVACGASCPPTENDPRAVNDNVGHQNDNSENWTSDAIDAVKTKVEDGMNWWSQTLRGITSKHELQFHYDYAHADDPGNRFAAQMDRFWIIQFNR